MKRARSRSRRRSPWACERPFRRRRDQRAAGVSSAEAFLEMMAVERAASPHTLDAYRRDLADYQAFLTRRGADILSADGAAVRGWLGQLSGAGRSNATIARRLSAVRQLHRFLFLE